MMAVHYGRKCKSNLIVISRNVDGSFGGVGFICSRIPICHYRDIHVDDDRMLIIEVRNGESVILTIIGVYMPYFYSTSTPIYMYSELLDKVHSLIDSAGSPVMLMGDMNATSPQTSQLSQNWYNARPFTSRSMLLYDLLCNNSLMSANFANKQSVDYIYNIIIESYMKSVHST